jgi:hypothetical protein
MKTRKSNFLTLAAVAVLSSLVTLLLVFGTSSISARQQQVTGNEDHSITLEQAVKYVQNFRNFPSVPTIRGGYFGRSAFDKILAQPGCVGIRFYYAQKDDGSPTMVLVGIDNGGNDMTLGPLSDQILPCPPYCPGPSPLNR